ncbi:MAG: hypothetical protein JWQ49_3446 [Edaphobacter sp.]|nr:hypothetical protein [Edaphobacter sp.]
MSHKKHPPANAAVEIRSLAADGSTYVGIAKHFKVAKETLNRWLEEDIDLAEAFEQGKDEERYKLHNALSRKALGGDIVAAMFLLKCRHGYDDKAAQHTNVNVGVSVAPSVLVMHSHGSDEGWEARSVAQQRDLVANAANPPKQIEATIEPPAYVPFVESAPAWMPAHLIKATPQTAPEAPEWRGNA